MRMPPSSRPIAPPAPAMPAHTPSALLRGAPIGKVVAIRASAVGAASAPPAPCTARAVEQPPFGVREPAENEPMTKSRMPAMKMRRRPKMSPRRPPSSSRLPKASE